MMNAGYKNPNLIGIHLNPVKLMFYEAEFIGANYKQEQAYSLRTLLRTLTNGRLLVRATLVPVSLRGAW